MLCVLKVLDDESAVGASRGSDATLTSSLGFCGKTLAAVFLRKCLLQRARPKKERERVPFSETMTALWF